MGPAVALLSSASSIASSHRRHTFCLQKEQFPLFKEKHFIVATVLINAPKRLLRFLRVIIVRTVEHPMLYNEIQNEQESQGSQMEIVKMYPLQRQVL